MRTIRIVLHEESAGVWAESPDLPELVAGGPTLDLAIDEAIGAVRFMFGEEVEVGIAVSRWSQLGQTSHSSTASWGSSVTTPRRGAGGQSISLWASTGVELQNA